MLFILILHAVRTTLMKGRNCLRKMLKGSPCKTAEEEYVAIKMNSSENWRYPWLVQKLTPWLTQQIVSLTCKSDVDAEQS
jgi:hypothetical protein